MSRTYDFLRECGVFYILTINGDYPAGRPFGLVEEIDNDLYISTNDFNQAHKQLRKNEHVQIIGKKNNSREWIRVTGTAIECNDKDIKDKIYNNNPILQKHHDTPDSSHYLVFKINIENVEFN